MTLTEYAVLAQRTASTKTAGEKIGHGVLGLIGEAGEIVDIIKKRQYMGMPGELAKEKLIDEAGDFAWYLVELCTGLGLSIERVFDAAGAWHTLNETVEDVAVDLAMRSADLHSDIDEALCAGLDVEGVACCYLDLLELADIDGQEVLEHNICKLKERYPAGFDADRSNERYE